VAANEKLGGQFMHHSRTHYSGSSGVDSGVDQYDYIKPVFGPQWDRDQQAVVHNMRDRSLLTMTVEHTPGSTAYAGIPKKEQGFDWEDSEPYQRPYDTERAQADFERPHPDNPDQPKLFGMHSTPGESKVDYMVGTEGGRTHAMTMLGIAQNKTIQDYGRSLMPSTDLSPHSHKLASHLSEKAGTKAPPVSGPSNGMGFSDEPGIYNRQRTSREIDAGEVRRGRNLVRRVVKGGSPDPRGEGPPESAMPTGSGVLNENQWRPRPGFGARRKPNPDQGTLF